MARPLVSSHLAKELGVVVHYAAIELGLVRHCGLAMLFRTTLTCVT